MITLERASCANPCRCNIPALLLNWGNGTGFRVRGCGGPYGTAHAIRPADLTARERKMVEEAVAQASARRRITPEEAEAFLAEVFQ